MPKLLAQPIRDGREGLWADHQHTCCVCGFEYTCLDYTRKECITKGVFHAAKVNGGGPYCEMCRCIEMARRHAQARGWTLVYEVKK